MTIYYDFFYSSKFNSDSLITDNSLTFFNFLRDGLLSFLRLFCSIT